MEHHPSFIEAQSKAERIYRAFGDSAPPCVDGESLTQYRRRLIEGCKAHTTRWKTADIGAINGVTLDIIESQVFSDAYAFAFENIPAGQLREITETDRTGRQISKFYGDPETCWAPFKYPSKIVTAWRHT